MRLINIVDGMGFREFCQELEQQYCVPKIPTQVVVCLVVLVCPPVIDMMCKY